MSEEELKISRMHKKAQSKKFFTRDNYKLREFVLTSDTLRYFDINGGSRGKLKGQLYLSSIKYVEKVKNDDLDNKINVFQIGYVEGENYNMIMLYIVANSVEEREDWMHLLRLYAKEQKANFQPRYHSGVWARAGNYSCCKESCRWSMGCELVSSCSDQQRRPSVIKDSDFVVALYNFNPMQDGQLPLLRGERYTIVDCGHPEWWYLRDSSGLMGYSPKSHVQKDDDLSAFDWFYGDISRQKAESILLDENREGCFLLRNSSSCDSGLTLSVSAKQNGILRVHHYRIRQIDFHGPYYLSEKHILPTIPELIEYHRYNAGGLVIRLRSAPLQDRDCPVTTGMGLDEFEVDVTEVKLDKVAIGQGQFGVVKKGEFRGMQVAVKQMVEGTMNEDDFVEEARNMRFLNHTNLVRLFGVVLKSRPIMIITEYMKYGSLREFLRSNYGDYWNKTNILCDVCGQVAKGMAYLEQRNYVHRDLAARNCLVKGVERRSLQVKVADFGMARFLVDNVYEPSAGTKFPVRWAAPEVFQAVYTSKADVWSFGVLMWEVFTSCLQVPYNGQTNSQVYQYILGGGRLSKPPACPDRLYVLMLECWQHDTNKRPGFSYISNKISDFLDQNCDN